MIFFVIIVVLILFVLITYNILIKKRNEVMQSKSTIDVYLTQRFDLIPNLVECVKQYKSYEFYSFEQIIKMRAKYMDRKILNEGNILNNEINLIIAHLENYPDLKSNEQFLNLQRNLTKIENQIQAARRSYNNKVIDYNSLVTIFPINIIAKICGFKSEEFFEADDESKVNINLSNNFNS